MFAVIGNVTWFCASSSDSKCLCRTIVISSSYKPKGSKGHLFYFKSAEKLLIDTYRNWILLLIFFCGNINVPVTYMKCYQIIPCILHWIFIAFCIMSFSIVTSTEILLYFKLS